MAETTGIAGAPTRRAVVAGVGAAGLAAALAACGDSNDSAGAYSPAAPPQGGDQGAGGSAPAGGGAEAALAKTSEIPVGGGKIFADKKVVVCQPEAGSFKAFSAICTHQGCAVNEIAGGTINCPCHGSKFSIKDGSVANGPATQPLAAANIKVEGDSVALA
ncbi:Rieske (2Fe-2S) protein [Actinacidiphila glaucinigra]|uniref:Rieske (2Fe-2S) protein n=1 Tax=Actinacidiphila glaucinigra TaxID=235986 RepID=UPI0029B30539|nr:Rieske (2Fe-2S) protein [Streptomyces sp. PA03-3a]